MCGDIRGIIMKEDHRSYRPVIDSTFAVSKRKPEKFTYMIFILKKGMHLAITPLLIF